MPKKYRYLTLIILLSFVATKSAFSQNQLSKEYIEKYRELAISEMKQFQIPASIKLAQASLESAYGNSTLAIKANNHFGIKCHEWQGESLYLTDDRANECFRKYKNVEESYRDHSLFLTERERYKELFTLPITDYKAWAHGLSKAGYATNPKYAQLLIKIIEEHSLFQYDIISSELEYRELLNHNLLKEVSSSLAFSITRPVFKNNGVSFIIAGKNDSYKELAKEYRLFKRELLRFNDLKKDGEILDGTIVYIENKKRKGEKGANYHIVAEGESIYEISQKYAIKLKRLYRLNNLQEREEIKHGDKITLQK